MALFELLYITKCARKFTGEHVVPFATRLPGTHLVPESWVEHLGGNPQVTGMPSLTFSAMDADRPLITRSQSLWETLEPEFLRQLEDQTGTATMSGQIKKALAEALPGGSASIDDMAKRLNVPKRSLQRRLS